MNFVYTLAAILDEDTIPLPKAQLTNGSNGTYDTVGAVLQLVFGVAGGVALLIIVIAGLRFVVANGDPQSVAKAKNTIIYSSLGLIVCLSGFSIVTFLMGQL